MNVAAAAAAVEALTNALNANVVLIFLQQCSTVGCEDSFLMFSLFSERSEEEDEKCNHVKDLKKNKTRKEGKKARGGSQSEVRRRRRNSGLK